MARNPNELLYEAGESPPWWTAALLGLTHVALIFDGVVLLPNILGKAAGLTTAEVHWVAFSTLIVSGLASLVQVPRVGRVGCGYIMFMGSYSAFVTCLLHAVAMGGFTAIGLSALLRLAPRKRILLRLPPTPESCARISEALSKDGAKLGLPEPLMPRLDLACEEAFLHMIAPATDGQSPACEVRLRIERQEGRAFVELESGDEVEEVLGEAQPTDLMHAPDQELGALGLAILRNMVADLNHMRISGVTYITFTL